ncbi:hypothetical protein [Streptomyces caniferus]|uniref:hypothetical protein n=1 Tax=Streptomyces caniferus TaxID=285557 RepID=UPI00382DCFCD
MRTDSTGRAVSGRGTGRLLLAPTAVSGDGTGTTVPAVGNTRTGPGRRPTGTGTRARSRPSAAPLL